MLKPRTTIDAADTQAKLDHLTAAIRREGEGAEADPFDEAMVAGVKGLAEAMKAESAELEAMRARIVRLARQVPR